MHSNAAARTLLVRGAHGVGAPAGPPALPRELAGGLADATVLRAHGRDGPGGAPTPCAPSQRFANGRHSKIKMTPSRASAVGAVQRASEAPWRPTSSGACCVRGPVLRARCAPAMGGDAAGSVSAVSAQHGRNSEPARQLARQGRRTRRRPHPSRAYRRPTKCKRTLCRSRYDTVAVPSRFRRIDRAARVQTAGDGCTPSAGGLSTRYCTLRCRNATSADAIGFIDVVLRGDHVEVGEALGDHHLEAAGDVAEGREGGIRDRWRRRRAACRRSSARCRRRCCCRSA